LPGPSIHPIRRTIRYGLARSVAWIAVRALFRVHFEGRERLLPGPALLCFNHQSWIDPFVLMASLPWRPRLYFFGPKEEDMAVGSRNRLMTWTGTAVPYKPGKNDLLEATHKVAAVFKSGGVLAIAGEGRIHAGESVLLPLNEGAAFFAIRSGVPLVPVAINGTSWLAFGRRLRVRVGVPIPTAGRANRDSVAALTATAWSSLHTLCQGYPDPPPPPASSRWHRLTELFNDWPEGSRSAAQAAAGESAARRPDTREQGKSAGPSSANA